MLAPHDHRDSPFCRNKAIDSAGHGRCARMSATNEPNRLVSAAIGLAQPKNSKQYGYLSEHHAYGETMRKSADFAEDLAATMLASTLGIELDPDVAWDERKQVYKVGKRLFKSRSVAQSAKGHKDGLWTTVVAGAVLLLDE